MKTKQLQKLKLNKCKPGQHQMANEKCTICGKTKEDIWLNSMEEDVPTCYSPSISEIERDLGHGFWGNPTTGYIYDKNNK